MSWLLIHSYAREMHDRLCSIAIYHNREQSAKVVFGLFTAFLPLCHARRPERIAYNFCMAATSVD